MSKINWEIGVIRILLICICLLYIIFLYIDIFDVQASGLSTALKFISIMLLFISSLLMGKCSLDENNIFILRLGLFVTLLADLFLLVLDSNYVLGIILFSIVQILHSIRYDFRRSKGTIRDLIIIFLILNTIYIIIKVDFLIIVGVYYTICLLTSTRKGIKSSIHRLYPRPNRHMITIGMMFFILCDISVVLYNLIGYIGTIGEYTYILQRISFVSIWTFYLPSQILLCLSEYKFK